MTAPDAGSSGLWGGGDEPFDDPPPPYSRPPQGFWDTQLWRPAEPGPPTEPGPPPYEPPPHGLGPEYHDLQTQRYDNQALVQEAMAWQQQAPARDPREALDSAQEALADNPTDIPIERLLTDPADKAGIERDLFDLDRPSPFDPPDRVEFEPPSQRLGAIRGLEHQQQTADHLRQQHWAHAQAQQHQQMAQELRDPQRWSEHYDRQADYNEQQAAERRDLASGLRDSGDPFGAEEQVAQQHNFEAQAQQNRDRAEGLRGWAQEQKLEHPLPAGDPDEFSPPPAKRPKFADTQPQPPAEHPVAQLSHDDAAQSAQALRDYAQHHNNQADSYESVDRTAREAAGRARQRAAREHDVAQVGLSR